MPAFHTSDFMRSIPTLLGLLTPVLKTLVGLLGNAALPGSLAEDRLVEIIAGKQTLLDFGIFRKV